MLTLKSKKIFFLALINICVAFAIIIISQKFLLIITLVLFDVLYLMMALLSEQLQQNQTMVIKKTDDLTSRIQSLLFFYNKVNPRKPLPRMCGSAIAPDMANILSVLFEKEKPKIIVECGSGVSTLILSYLIEEEKQGFLYSLDHLKKYADITQDHLKDHNLEDFAEVLYSPLEKYRLKEKDFRWYDLKGLNEKITDSIDMLIIDGPPRGINPKVRYPALPLLMDKLSRKCVVVLDDAARLDELNVLDDWLLEFKDFEMKWFDTEKGTAVLYRKDLTND